MQRFGALALVAALAATGGCASSAKYVEKKADSGIVAVPNESDGWPDNNRRAALELIEKHVGPNYEILDERTVPTGRVARTALPETNETLNPRNPASPARQAPGASVPQNATQYQITYRRKDGPAVGDMNRGATTGLTSAGGTTVQTQYPPPGTVPNVQPAGGPMSVFNRNTVRPAGGANCDY